MHKHSGLFKDKGANARLTFQLLSGAFPSPAQRSAALVVAHSDKLFFFACDGGGRTNW